MPLTTNPDATSTTNQQRNTDQSLGPLAQSEYDFRYRVFPNDLGMDALGHYMVININVPVKVASTGVSADSQFSNQFRLLPGDASKVDTLRFGPGGSLNPFAGLPGVNLPSGPSFFPRWPWEWFGSGNSNAPQDRPWAAFPRYTRRIAESIALHMPTPLVYNTQNEYEEISLTALAGNVLAGVVGGTASTIASAIPTATAVTMQRPINPAVEVVFTNVYLRQFVMEFLFAPRNEEESINLHAIIKTLRFHGAPEIADSLSGIPAPGGLFWIPPAEFDITFYNKGVENTNILRINTCVLDRCEVDYSPSGVYSTFRNGHPVTIRLSMAFRELEPIHKKRVLQGF